jgi:hypothetical protein
MNCQTTSKPIIGVSVVNQGKNSNLKHKLKLKMTPGYRFYNHYSFD